MRITVLYFASLRERIGVASETRETTGSIATVGDLAQHLIDQHPGLSLAGLRFACNEQFVDPSHRLSDGDTVALIPPVSGG